jgi:hypothetical protein
MKRDVILESAEVQEAIARWRNFSVDGEVPPAEASEFSWEPEYEFIRGYFVGTGLSYAEAEIAADFICSTY